MHAQAEISRHKLSDLGEGKRRMLVNCLASMLAVQAHDLAALGRTDLVYPILHVKRALQLMSDEMACSPSAYSGDVVAGAIRLINTSKNLLSVEYLLMTIH